MFDTIRLHRSLSFVVVAIVFSDRKNIISQLSFDGKHCAAALLMYNIIIQCYGSSSTDKLQVLSVIIS